MMREKTENNKGKLDKKNSEGSLFNTPRLPEEIYENLPSILKESAELFEEATEKDVFLIGALTVLSGCLPNVQGLYFDEPYSPHLYSFIIAPAGSGKGKMKWARYLGQTIHDYLVERSKTAREAYYVNMERYNNLDRRERLNENKPAEPPLKMFFIPANSSSSAFIQALTDNDFTGVIFETEADTLANTFKQDWGNFSDVLRKAFHHENTSLFRRKDNEFVEVDSPHIAIALSGTPRQVLNMMPDVENGLFSRFLYYVFEDNSEFKNPFVSHRQIDYIKYFKEKGMSIFDLYQKLKALSQPIIFSLTKDHANYFTSQFDLMLNRSKLLPENNFEAIIKRLGLIAFRIAMLFTSLRLLKEDNFNKTIICNDTDLITALKITTTLEKHAVAIFRNLPWNDLHGAKKRFYDSLPGKFDRQIYLKTAREIGLKEKTAEKYIGKFKKDLLEHEYNQYKKRNDE